MNLTDQKDLFQSMKSWFTNSISSLNVLFIVLSIGQCKDGCSKTLSILKFLNVLFISNKQNLSTIVDLSQYRLSIERERLSSDKYLISD